MIGYLHLLTVLTAQIQRGQIKTKIHDWSLGTWTDWMVFHSLPVNIVLEVHASRMAYLFGVQPPRALIESDWVIEIDNLDAYIPLASCTHIKQLANQVMVYLTMDE